MAKVAKPEERGEWRSRTGFLLAAIGSAVGLGNIWRFPYMAYQNGGGAFLIPYFLALIAVGIPLMILEYGVGHHYRGSAPAALSKISKRAGIVGWWAVSFVMFGIVLYYAVIISWCCNYLMYSFNFSWGIGAESDFFYGKFLGLTSGPSDLGLIQLHIIGALAIVWFINWFIVYKGIQRGVELANKIFMPLLFILTLILVLWSFTLEGSGIGLGAYLKPDLSKLTNFKVWTDAFGQIFFSLSLGFGIMIAYASYLPEKADITTNAIITCLVNTFFSLFAGLAVFGTLGYMSHVTGQPLGEIIKQGIGLAFIVYPKAIGMLPAYGQIFGVIFFLSLVVAGISSSISIIEAFTCALLDKFPQLRRGDIVTVLSLLGFMGGIIFSTGGGLYWLDIIDHFLNNYALVIVGMAECFVAGWMAKIEPLREYINEISQVRLRQVWDHLIRFVVPIILAVIVLGAAHTDLLSPYGGYPGSYIVMIGLGKLLLTAVLAVILYKLPSEEEQFEGV